METQRRGARAELTTGQRQRLMAWKRDIAANPETFDRANAVACIATVTAWADGMDLSLMCAVAAGPALGWTSAQWERAASDQHVFDRLCADLARETPGELIDAVDQLLLADRAALYRRLDDRLEGRA